ncbi:scavenger receptor cysteine-rich domain-containing protein DMBT1-like, partial [Scyliorhinus torazame]|uniref:scavenger receptor cysteine-rich domain-containing protein DMBT1-like n=1 Tax=Scyliorhinus torazame TaxID=75743 RepID=UPI003B5B05B6
MRDAAIVCRELDCGTALSALGKAHFGKGNGTHVTGNVECTGTETALSQCASDRWDHEAENSHSDDAGVICSGSDKLRLVNGSSPCAGRLEIYSSGSWSTVWGDEFSWSSLDADVVCKELDCGSGVAAPLNSHFGQGPGPVIGPPGCGHQQDVGVICSDANWSLRLTDGGSRCDGRVEIYYDRAWGRIQDKLWDLNDAHVVCRQLGCGDGIAAYNSSKDGASARSVWLIDIQCNGNEAHLQNCSSSLFNYSLNDSTGIGVLCSDHMQLRVSGGGSQCAGRLEVYYNEIWGTVCDDSWNLTDADVVCKQLGCGNALAMSLPASSETDSGPVWLDDLTCSEHKELRLANGDHRCEGRVEIFHNGSWGTVCSDILRRSDAEVICKQLQCGSVVSIQYGSGKFGEGTGPIRLNEMGCTSHERSIWQCGSDSQDEPGCSHRDDASVVCSGANVTKEPLHSSMASPRESDLRYHLRLVNGNTNCSGRVEILYNKLWGTVCDDSWDMADASVVCRQLACGSALLAEGGAAFAQGDGVIWLDEVKCTGSELYLSDCPSSSFVQSDCDHKEDARVMCSGLQLSPNSHEPTPSEQAGVGSIPLAVCMTLGGVLIMELIALMAVIQEKKIKRK